MLIICMECITSLQSLRWTSDTSLRGQNTGEGAQVLEWGINYDENIRSCYEKVLTEERSAYVRSWLAVLTERGARVFKYRNMNRTVNLACSWINVRNNFTSYHDFDVRAFYIFSVFSWLSFFFFFLTIILYIINMRESINELIDSFHWISL